MKKNLLLVGLSLVLVLALLKGADWFVGRLLAGPQPEGTVELIFPPKSEKSFEMAEFRYDVHINSLGLRDREFDVHRGKAYRICAIGDSFTYGWGVQVEQSWPKVLEANLKQAGHDVEVINLGKPGAGPPFYGDLAQRAIPLLRPDLVIVAPLQDDLGESIPDGDLSKIPMVSSKRLLDRVRWLFPNLVRLARIKETVPVATKAVSSPERNSIADNRRINQDAAKGLLNQMTPQQRERFEKLEEGVKRDFLDGNLNPYMFDLSILKNPDLYSFLLKIDDDYIKLCIKAMGAQFSRIADAAASVGADILIVPVPLGPYVNEAANRNLRRVGFNTDETMLASDNADLAIERAADSAGCRFDSVTAGFREKKSETGLFYELDGHFTPAGHKLFADLLTPVVEGYVR